MNVAYTLVERIGKEEGIFRIKESNTLSRQQKSSFIFWTGFCLAKKINWFFTRT